LRRARGTTTGKASSAARSWLTSRSPRPWPARSRRRTGRTEVVWMDLVEPEHLQLYSPRVEPRGHGRACGNPATCESGRECDGTGRQEPAGRRHAALTVCQSLIASKGPFALFPRPG